MLDLLSNLEVLWFDRKPQLERRFGKQDPAAGV
jgi:hypothetical protein